MQTFPHSLPILTDADIDPTPLLNRRVAMLGYGNQGRPQALNLRDSGVTVRVGLRSESRHRAQALQDGFPVLSLAEAADDAEVVMLMLPDEEMGDIYAQTLAPILEADPQRERYLGVCHGLSVHAGWLTPAPFINVFLVAPKAQGRGVRAKYVAGGGVPAFYAVHQDPSGKSEAVALAYARALGCGRVGVFPTTFREETVCDLFSEQTVLCGGLTGLIKTAFETLTERGFSPEAAYFECLYEVKLIGDLLHERGIYGMREAISSTALMGDLTRGGRIIDGHVRNEMRNVLDEIENGRFAAELREDFQSGRARARELLAQDAHHPIETVHQRLTSRLHAAV